MHTLIATASGTRPEASALAREASTVPKVTAVGARPFSAGYLLKGPRKSTVARWKECTGGARVLAQVEAVRCLAYVHLVQHHQYLVVDLKLNNLDLPILLQ